MVDAACRCFARYGYGPSTNNLIAETAGVTAGSVYYHFRTKRHLFGSVCEDVYGQLAKRLDQLEPGNLSVSGLLRLVMRAALLIGAGGHPDELNRVADLFEGQVLDVGPVAG